MITVNGMDKENVKRYILERGEVESPALQKELSLTYAEAKSVLDELVQGGTLEYASGVLYRIKDRFAPQNGERVYKPKDATEDMYLRALWTCIKLGGVSLSAIQNTLHVDYGDAVNAIGWMDRNGFITMSPRFRIIITREEFVAKFGDFDGGTPFDRPKTELEKAHELWKILNEGEEKQPDEDEEDEDIELLLADYMEDEEAECYNGDDDDDDDDDDYDVDPKALIVSAVGECLQSTADENVYIFGLDGEPDFELKFVRDGRAVVISDCGRTVERTELTKRRITNILKDRAPVMLNGDAIEISVENPYGLLKGLMLFYAAVDAVRRAK